MDTKVNYVLTRTACTVHGATEGSGCWSFPARTDNRPNIVGICMRRAALSGILNLEAKRQYLLGAKKG